jgi:hypothetical protein
MNAQNPDFEEDIEDLVRHAEPFEAHGCRFTNVCQSKQRCAVSKERSSILLCGSRLPALRGFGNKTPIRNLGTPFLVVARWTRWVKKYWIRAIDYLGKPVPLRK